MVQAGGSAFPDGTPRSRLIAPTTRMTIAKPVAMSPLTSPMTPTTIRITPRATASPGWWKKRASRGRSTTRNHLNRGQLRSYSAPFRREARCLTGARQTPRFAKSVAARRLLTLGERQAARPQIGRSVWTTSRSASCHREGTVKSVTTAGDTSASGRARCRTQPEAATGSTRLGS
jgi:hypothetical protein